MKKIKITVAALAFVFAIGAAAISKANSANVGPCTTTNPKTSGECPGPDQQPCCTQNGLLIEKAF